MFFGTLKEIVGRSEDLLSLPEGSAVADALSHYEEQFPELKGFRSSLAFGRNREYVSEDARLREGDEIAFLPPVSGGSHAAPSAPPAERLALTREPIDSASLIEQIKQSSDGALVVFDGIVRNETRGRPTKFLFYEAYEAMAEARLRALREEACRLYPIREAWIRHRLGRLEIGETSVLIVVASAHRAAAFDACRWLIDSLKRTVPIWKQEHFEDGAVWAAGEPFPPDLGGVGRAEKHAER